MELSLVLSSDSESLQAIFGQYVEANIAATRADRIAAQEAADNAQSSAVSAATSAEVSKGAADRATEGANSAIALANDALSKAGSALDTANSANATATGIDGKATQALNVASAANTTAAQANTKADQALAASNGTYNSEARIYQNGDEGKLTLWQGSRQTPGTPLWAITAANFTSKNGDLYLNRYDNTGAYAGSPVIVSRVNGWVTVASGFTSGQESVFNGRVNFFGNIDNTSTSARGMTIGRDGSNVGVRWRRTEGTTDAKVWDMVVDANDNILKGRVVNDAVNAAADWLRVSRTAMAVDSVWFGTRPQWNVSKTDGRLATAWDSLNFDPNTKANISNPTFQGSVTTPTLTVDNSSAYSVIVIKAGNYAPRIQTSQTDGMTGFVNAANTAYNFQIFDNGDTTTRGYATFQRGMTISDRPVVARNGWQADLQLQNLSGNQNSNVFLRARIGGGLEVINSAYTGIPWSVSDGGETWQTNNAHVGGATFGTNGDVFGSAWSNDWLSTWLANQLGAKQAAGNYMRGADTHAYSVGWDGGPSHLNFLVDGNLVGYVTSDENAKRNIQNSTVDALARIAKIEFKEFDYADEPFLPKEHVDNGVIAQQIVGINPNWVYAPPAEYKNAYCGLNTQYMLFDAMKAIQQLNKEVEELKAKLVPSA